MLHEIGNASALTQGTTPNPWREDPTMLCEFMSNRRLWIGGQVNVHCP